jgi:NAD(P)-dependent dehydrogenase (short-subunit alcohol dehydrogenase family)
MVDLAGKVCIVTGASRGVGRGIARGLLEVGATVHISARTVTEGEHPLDRAGSLETMVADAAGLPGRLHTHRVDHARDDETEALVRGVIEAEGRLDVLVNNAWPGYERMEEEVEPGRNPFTWIDPIWEQPMWRWDAMIGVGARAAWCATRVAAGQMAKQRSGLIVNISYWAAQKFMGNVVYGISKAVADKMAADVGFQLREFNIAAVSLYPGLVRTEEVMKNAQYFDMSNSESPEFIGRAVAHLAADPRVLDKSGRVHLAAALAVEYGFTDIDGRQPRPTTLEAV